MTVPQELKDKLSSYARMLDIPEEVLPEYDTYSYEGTSYIEYKDGLYHLAAMERGQDIIRQTTPDMDQMAFWVFRNISASIAADYASDHSPGDQDPRRFAYEKQKVMLTLLNPGWASKIAQWQAGQLEHYPFDDFYHQRQDYQQEILDNGEAEKSARLMRFSDSDAPVSDAQITYEAARMALIKYPYAVKG
jgi:hypothetical protein